MAEVVRVAEGFVFPFVKLVDKALHFVLHLALSERPW